MIKKIIAALLFFLPSVIKVFVLNHLLGCKIHRSAKIGFSYVNVPFMSMGPNSRIGHFNFISHVGSLEIGSQVIFGHFNILLGGKRVVLGDACQIGRFNEMNSILNPLVRGNPEPEFWVGRYAVVTAWHKIDYTDKVTLGESVVLAGRLSNLWTHNRQDVKPVSIGRNCYVGSGIQMVPGSRIGPHCVVGLGSVITRAFDESYVLVAGVPAKVVKPLDESSRILVEYTTRPDLDGAGPPPVVHRD